MRPYSSIGFMTQVSAETGGKYRDSGYFSMELRCYAISTLRSPRESDRASSEFVSGDSDSLSPCFTPPKRRQQPCRVCRAQCRLPRRCRF